MSDEVAFLDAIRANPNDDTTRLVYADWLDERDDPRAAFVRLHLALRSVAPDHVQRVAGEHELSQLRKGLAAEWLKVVEPERAHLSEAIQPLGVNCKCFSWHSQRDLYPIPPGSEFHTEPQDTECDAWKRLCDSVEQAAAKGWTRFAPFEGWDANEEAKIVTLPPTIAKLKQVTDLSLSSCDLVRIPPEIGEMTALRGFDAYMSYRLHWYPYEITRCKDLRSSAVSTRALYGNWKFRPPFPRLEAGLHAGRVEPAELPLKCSSPGLIRKCSVCDQPFRDRRQYRVWISLMVGTDVLPLLVNACSPECIGELPTPPERYMQNAHRGGPEARQPEAEY